MHDRVKNTFSDFIKVSIRLDVSLGTMKDNSNSGPTLNANLDKRTC